MLNQSFIAYESINYFEQTPNIFFQSALILPISTHLEKKIKMRWTGPKINAIWFFFSKYVIFPSAMLHPPPKKNDYIYEKCQRSENKMLVGGISLYIHL